MAFPSQKVNEGSESCFGGNERGLEERELPSGDVSVGESVSLCDDGDLYCNSGLEDEVAAERETVTKTELPEKADDRRGARRPGQVSRTSLQTADIDASAGRAAEPIAMGLRTEELVTPEKCSAEAVDVRRQSRSGAL